MYMDACFSLPDAYKVYAVSPPRSAKLLSLPVSCAKLQWFCLMELPAGRLLKHLHSSRFKNNIKHYNLHRILYFQFIMEFMYNEIT